MRASLQEKALRLLERNAKTGNGYYYTAPSLKKYPHQWSWDSAFCAIVNCRLGRPDRAKAEVMTLLETMLPDGTLPHIIFHQNSLTTRFTRIFRFYWPEGGRSPLVQPPVVALAAENIWQATGDIAFLKKALPLLERHFNWLTRQRRFGDSPLVSILSPWESGLDHKPGFDSLLGWPRKLPFGRYVALYAHEMRLARINFDTDEIKRRGYFRVEEVLFNTIYALGLQALGRMFDANGDAAKARSFRLRAEAVTTAIMNDCYDEQIGLCFDRNGVSGNLIREPSVSCLMPLALENIPENQYAALLDHLSNTEEFGLRFPIPSVPKNSRHFHPSSRSYLWRGPTWINTNWLIAEGLKRNGLAKAAETIAQASRELVERAGFREYYNPLTGQGGGANDFSWSTLAAVM